MAFQLLQDCIDMDVEMTASSHAVLVVLCRHANDAGECFPSTALIAKKSHLNPRTVMQAVRELEKGAWISCTQAPGKKRRFVVDVAKVKALVTTVENCTPEKSPTPADSCTPAEKCTPVESCTPAENDSEPLQESAGDPCRKLHPNRTLREQEENTTDIRPKLADDVPPPSLDDYGIEDVPTDFNLSAEPAPVPEPETDKPIDRVPVKYFVDSYNEILGEVLGKVIKVTPQRRQLIGARYRDIWRDCECLNEDEARAKVRSFFSCISRSDFLMGRTNRQGAHASWKPTFDWLLQQRNYTKILEGAYRNGQR